jgi:hypothetical protein
MKRTMTGERFLTSTAVAAVVSLCFLLMLARPADGRAPHSAQASNAAPQSSMTSRDQTRSIEPAAVARFPQNIEEFDRMFEGIKDWGQWGPNDQLEPRA